MLLRNFNTTNGHCNGTRYIVTELHQHVIEAEIAVGLHAETRLFIPCIPLIPSDNTYPFQMKRRQFPIKLAFGITVNKAQGQTLQRVGIYLPTDMFSHGQLYVAMSRATASCQLKNSANEPNKTKNIVYKEVLLHVKLQ